MAKFEFPKGFYWGAATSAHQVEGDNHNDWSEWEKATNHPVSGHACGHYNYFREDFDIAKSLSHNAHMFSIEWSRIEPVEGKWNEKEVQHYQEVINALRERDMEPFVTLWHWTLPLWVAKQGGWKNKKTISDFVSYAEKITSSIQGVKFWITLNEPEVYTGNSYFVGIWPPQKKNLLQYIVVMQNLIEAHKKTYEKIKKLNIQIGIAKNNIYFEGIFSSLAKKILNSYFLDKIKKHQDFIGLNYYFHKKFFSLTKKETGVVFSDMGWEVFPEGIFHLVKDLKKYKKPIYITENGIADKKDEKRREFIKEHIKWIARAMNEGVDVRGYLYWSLLDNFEWDKGFWPRFGLVEMDYKHPPTGGERKIRPSAYEYKKIIEENSVEI